jgi:enamine deaminase RidA (YjgF/YER057c/UK114 family)
MPGKRFINPPGLKQLGTYTHVTAASGGTLVFISGQVAVDAEGNVVGKGDIRAQAKQVFENLKLALAGAGATFEDVIKFTIFIVGLNADARKAVMEVRGNYISKANPPAATMIGIDKLVLDELLLEIEAVAHIDQA